MRTSYVVTDSYSTGRCGFAGLGIAFRGGRIICGDIVEAPDLLTAELLAVCRAVEIAAKVPGVASVIYTDHTGAFLSLTHGCSSVAARIRDLLRAHEGRITVELAPREATKAARIVARQTFKAWRCSFDEGVTWSAPETPSAVAA